MRYTSIYALLRQLNSEFHIQFCICACHLLFIKIKSHFNSSKNQFEPFAANALQTLALWLFFLMVEAQPNVSSGSNLPLVGMVQVNLVEFAELDIALDNHPWNIQQLVLGLLTLKHY